MRQVTTAILGIIMLSSISMAQTTTTRITTLHFEQGAPSSQMTFSVKCDGDVLYNLSNSQITITDNGKQVNDYSITESSSPAVHKDFSAALVLDASGSMSGSGNAGTKSAARAFVGFMADSVDEAALLYFSSVTTLVVPMTDNKALLMNEIDRLGASGATAVYDAAYAGLVHVNSQSSNATRAVVVMTDGGDNSSTKTPADVIAYAKLVDIRVFTIGLGSAINSTILTQIGQQTGGAYFASPNAVQLAGIFQQIASFVGRGFDEHVVTFRSPDPDAKGHEVILTVRACDGYAESTMSEASILTTGIRGSAQAAPEGITLGSCIPNPVRSNGGYITVDVSPEAASRHQQLSVYDILGRNVATLIDGRLRAGRNEIRFDTRELTNGVYFYQLQSGGKSVMRKLLIQR